MRDFKMHKTVVDIDVDIDDDDLDLSFTELLSLVTNSVHASSIAEELASSDSSASLEDVMKQELIDEYIDKYSLSELEERLKR